MPEHLDQLFDAIPIIYFIGLSSKPNCAHLAPETKTGQIINQIIDRIPSVSIVKSNLVRATPIDPSGKLRYPTLTEMKIGWEELKYEIDFFSPLLIVLLGQQVSCFLRSQIGIQPIKSNLPCDYSYQPYFSPSTSIILSVHHPSFIYVYRRKDIDDYINKVALLITSILPGEYQNHQKEQEYYNCCRKMFCSEQKMKSRESIAF